MISELSYFAGFSLFTSFLISEIYCFTFFKLKKICIDRCWFETKRGVSICVCGLWSKVQRWEWGLADALSLLSPATQTLCPLMASSGGSPHPLSLLCRFFLWCSLQCVWLFPPRVEIESGQWGITLETGEGHYCHIFVEWWDSIWGTLWRTLVAGKRLATFPDKSRLFRWLS